MSPNHLDAGKSAETLCAERNQRIWDAVTLKKPDRVPLLMMAGYLLAEYGGISNQTLQDDFEAGQAVLERFALEFEPDNVTGPVMHPAAGLALGDRMSAWPGHGLPEDGQFQFVENEFMKAEDYPAFLHDPSDWIIRTYLPRAFSKLEGFQHLPPLGMWSYGIYCLDALAFYGAPGVREAIAALGEAMTAVAKRGGELIDSAVRLSALGIPPYFGAGSLIEAPFDFMSDTMRGMRGIMLDMLRHPDQLLEAEARVFETQLEYALQFARVTGLKVASLPLHRGSDGFMSLTQFERFYWPQLKQLLVALIDNGITPFVFYEGAWDKRLEYLAELPKGKSVGWFQKSDIFRVKEVVGDTMCVMGGMPNSLLTGGSVSEIRERTHQVCEIVGKGGGFIMGSNVGEMAGSKLENVRAWADATREFGVY